MTDAQREPDGRWGILALLSLSVLLVLGTWFSGTTVVPSLEREWEIDRVGAAPM